jgi:hypothetical protein
VSEYLYNCARARKDLTELVRILKEVDVLQAAPDDEFLGQCVESCEPCRKDGRPKRCCGWHTVIDRKVLSFGPLTYGGDRQIRLELSADCDYRRLAPGRQPAWGKSPLGASVITLEVFGVEAEKLLERHHLDLANAGSPGQAGPVWHLQMGGNPAGSVDPTETGWLDLPRWPTAPMDLTLAIEFLAYSFFPEKWVQLNDRGDWFRLMVGAEQLVVSHFAEHMADHFRREADNRDRTWLAAQDNESGAFDPRPISS